MGEQTSEAGENDGWDSAAPSSPEHVLAVSMLDRAQKLAEVDDGAKIDVAVFDEAVRSLDEIVETFGASADIRLREVVADALFWKSQALIDLGRIDDALVIADELKRRVAGAPELSLRKRLCHALYCTAMFLRGGGPDLAAAAVAICRDAIERFGAEEGLWFRRRVLHLIIEQSFALKFLERRAEGVTLRNETRARYRDDPEPSLREHAERVIAAMDDRFDITADEKLENRA